MMFASAVEKRPEFKKAKDQGSRCRPTAIILNSGATLLSSLDCETARELITSSDKTGKGRLRREPDGGIELIDSLWGDYGDTHTDLHAINDLIHIKDRMLSLCRMENRACESTVIVDWGCGAGHTLGQLDRWLGEMRIAGVQLYGFANEFHSDWHHAPPNMTFILDVADNLPAYFCRRTVDLIYSIAGLYYLFIPEGGDDDMLEFFKKHRFDNRLFKYYAHTEEHLEALSGIMKSNGELLIDLPVHVIDIDYDLLKTDNKHYMTFRNPEKYGEYAYVVVPSTAGSA